MDWSQVRAEFPAPTPNVILRNVVTKNPSPPNLPGHGASPVHVLNPLPLRGRVRVGVSHSRHPEHVEGLNHIL